MFNLVVLILPILSIVDACQIGPRNFGFDLSMFKPTQFFRFNENFEKLGPMNRLQFIQYFKNDVAPVAPLYEVGFKLGS